jgi:hypothetical protein
MELSRKQIDASVIEKAEADIERLDQIISRRNLAGRALKGDKEGAQAALELFKSYRNACYTNQQNCFFKPNHVRLAEAVRYAGEIMAMDYVIAVLEDPKNSTYVYRAQLEVLQKNLAEMKKIPLRPED